ncbi:MAG: TetR/AcrR family transcriptional regulator [Chloroflexota bacterium]|nr:TetR/AcrR family transcriptional regulator [Chloroflexota bacterium]
MRQEKRRQATREHLLATAERLFALHGFDETTVDDIVEAADLAKGTFYYHFQSKDELAETLIRQIIGQASQQAQEALAGGASPVAALRLCFSELARLGEQHTHLLPAMLNFNQAFKREPPAGQPSMRRFLLPLLAAGQQAGQLRTDMETIELVQMLGLLFVYACMAWRGDRAGLSLNTHMQHALAIFLEGALTGEKPS